jgi:hypothetical protein
MPELRVLFGLRWLDTIIAFDATDASSVGPTFSPALVVVA